MKVLKVKNYLILGLAVQTYEIIFNKRTCLNLFSKTFLKRATEKSPATLKNMKTN